MSVWSDRPKFPAEWDITVPINQPRSWASVTLPKAVVFIREAGLKMPGREMARNRKGLIDHKVNIGSQHGNILFFIYFFYFIGY